MLGKLVNSTEAHLRASLEHIARGQRRQIVIFLDNVDQRPLQFQEQVFLIAQALAATWPGTVFVSLRPETFYASRVRGSLAAYQPRVFTIAPPRIDHVLRRRLEFAQAQLKKKGTLGTLGDSVTFQSHHLEAYIRALLHSLENNRELVELLDNLSRGNVREALSYVTAFVGSGHVNSEKIVEIVEQSGRYTIPVHEFLRAIIYVDNQHYDPIASAIANLFDISTPDEREHFLLPLLISFVERAGEGGAEGFVQTAAIFEEAQRLGFQPSQAGYALERALNKKLLEANLRGVSYGDVDRYRITSAGAYTTKRLMRLFTYIDAMIVDTPIVDSNTRRLTSDVWRIGERVARMENFRRYLDCAWVPLAGIDTPFEWPEISAELQVELDNIGFRIAAQD
jgi:hypothetical protein